LLIITAGERSNRIIKKINILIDQFFGGIHKTGVKMSARVVIELPGGVTGVDGEFRSALEHQGSSQEDDAIFSSAEHERSPHVEILVSATRATL
jgi:hypothetical protein